MAAVFPQGNRRTLVRIQHLGGHASLLRIISQILNLNLTKSLPKKCRNTLAVLYCALAEEVRLVDLDPNEAQQLINSQDQTLKYAPKIESNVPAVRYLGNEPHHVQEDIYLAKQYHGQDGLGGYLYGYQVPDIAKNEKKEASGSLAGAYNYINGDGKEIKVQYWDNGDGFHQEDNVAEVAPKQVEDAPDVAAAKEEFFRRWNEEAERNKHPIVDPNANASPYLANQQQGIQQHQYQHQPAGGPQYFSNPNPLQNTGPNVQYTGAGSSVHQQNVPYNQGQQHQSSTGPNYGSQLSHSQQQPQSTGYASVPQTTFAPTQPQGGQYQGSYQGQAQTSYGPSAQQWSSQESQSSVSHTSNKPQGCKNSGQPCNAQFQPNALQTGGQYQLSQSQARSTQPPNPNKYQTSQNQIDYSGQLSENKNYYAQAQNDGKYLDGENQEENGPPKGFFYSFEYPVGIIVQKGERALPQGENRNVRDVYEQNKANFEAQLQAGKTTGSQSSYLYVKH